jgi:hypothetical protein
MLGAALTPIGQEFKLTNEMKGNEMMFTTFVVQRVGKMIGAQSDFGTVYLALASLTTFALVIVFVLLRPRWLRIE